MAKLLLGKEVTAAMNEKLQARVAALKEKGVSPKLAIVRCGENPSDLSYEKGATARAELIGVEVQKFVLPEDVTKERSSRRSKRSTLTIPSTAALCSGPCRSI